MSWVCFSTRAFYMPWLVLVFVTVSIFILLLFKETFQGPLIVQTLSYFKYISKLGFPYCSANTHQICLSLVEILMFHFQTML